MNSTTRLGKKRLLVSLLSVAVLSACGGGGGGSVASDQASLDSQLLGRGNGNSGDNKGNSGNQGNGNTRTSTSPTTETDTTTPTTETTDPGSTDSDSTTPPLSSTPTPSPTSPEPITTPFASIVAGPAVNLAGAITTVAIDSTSNAEQTNVPVTFGQVFKQGDVLPTEKLVGKLADGSAIPIQVDIKATHSDGSLRHAIISAILPALPAGKSLSIGLAKTSGSVTSTTTSPTTLTNAGFTASANITLGGQLYTASADALLKGNKVTTWLSGPIVNEWHVWAPLKTAGGVEHPHLTARFAIRSYVGMNKARVDVTIENAWAYEPGPQNLTYDVQVAIGNQYVYSKTGLNHYHHARWRKVFWWGSNPQVHVKHRIGYLIASKALPNYDQTIQISIPALSSLKASLGGSSFEPMGSGLAAPYMPMTGGRPEIGLIPGWAATYLLSMDKSAKEATLAAADSAGSWSAHYRDKVTGRVISLVDYPYMTLLGRSTDTYNPATNKFEAFPECGGDCTNPNTADSSHQPSFAYLPYLITGDNYYLEEIQFWAMWNLFQHHPSYRETIKGLVQADQIRGQAWSLRTLAEAAYITPDTDHLKKQFENFLSNNLDWYNIRYTNNGAANSLGVLTNGYAFSYESETAIAPWQDDFFTSAIGHAAELGFTKADALLAWKARFPIGRMTDSSFCWIEGASYTLKIRDTNASPLYNSFSEAYRASHTPAFNALACASAEMASNLGLQVGEMTGYSSSNIGYPSNMQPALAYSVDSGTANSLTAWQKFMARSVKPDYQNSPQFAIVPR